MISNNQAAFNHDCWYDGQTFRSQSPLIPTQSISYMIDFMNYTLEQTDFLLNLFRHKLVHLAQPRLIIRRNELIAWRYHHHDDNQFHLRKMVLPSNPKKEYKVTSGWNVSVTHEFNISIKDLVRDIKDSVKRSNGYLDKLENTSHLQDKFEVALDQ